MPVQCGADQIRDLELLEFVASPGELLVGGGEEMESADECIDRRRGKFFFGEGERVDDARVSAAGDENQTLSGVEHKRLIFGDGVFDQSGGGLHFATH